MIHWLTEIFSSFDLTWSHALWGLVLFLGTFIGSLVLAGLLMVKLPCTYFCDSHSRDLWIDRHPVIGWSGLIIKNLLGVLLLILGAIMALPGIPGPGILTILIGVMLLDFPGKRRLEHWLLSRPMVLTTINRLRQRFGKPPLVLDSRRTSSPVKLDNSAYTERSLGDHL